jgi:hypothetical protein
LAAYAASLAVAGVLLARRGSVRDLGPPAVIVLAQALWFSVPVAVRHWQAAIGVEPFSWEFRGFYFPWIALGHCVQYVWCTTYYARESPRWGSYPRYFIKILVAGAAIWTLPVILLDPSRVGILPNTASLALLVAAAVNIHHFMLDGVIWKLRSASVAKILIPTAETPRGAAVEVDPMKPWQLRAGWSVAAVGCALAVFMFIQRDLLLPWALKRNDLVAARAILERVDWVSEISADAWKSLSAAEIEESSGYSRPGQP